MAQYLPISAARLEDIRAHTKVDPDLQTLLKVIATGWPQTKQEIPAAAAPYFHFRDELSEQDGVIFRGNRAVVPTALRHDMLERIHSAHIGIEGCLRRSRECLYWPGMGGAVKEYIEKCSICRSFDSRQGKETLHSHEVPNRAWAKIGTDLFSCNDRDYLVTVDYYSGFWEVDALNDTKAQTVIHKLKAHFARYGIPDICMSDDGPQFFSDEFKRFSRKWQFKHTTSSPAYPQSNGKVEQAAKAAKTLMKKAKKTGTDPYLSLLAQRNTPMQGLDSSPAQRLMCRRTKTLLPTTASLLEPKLITDVEKKLRASKERQAHYYNQGAKDLDELKAGDIVRASPIGKEPKEPQKAIVLSKVGIRAYEVRTENGRTYIRNRRHLRKSQEPFYRNYITQPTMGSSPASSPPAPSEPPKEYPAAKSETAPAPIQTAPDRLAEPQPEATPAGGNSSSLKTTRSGRVIKPPQRFKDYV